ncbi:hypothetical protein [Paractinoplanes rishiriensis]|nr:hypothetical protein [Actinoplanes rishiriensis]
MLHLLTTLLPPGRTSGYAAPDDLSVQLYLDEGAGPGLVRATGSPPVRPSPPTRPSGSPPTRAGT